MECILCRAERAACEATEEAVRVAAQCEEWRALLIQQCERALTQRAQAAQMLVETAALKEWLAILPK